MTSLIDKLLISYFKFRQEKIRHVYEHPTVYQNRILHKILKSNNTTDFGNTFQFKSIKDVASYVSEVPLCTYEQLFPYINRMMQDEENVLCSDKIHWFAKSSGTSNDRSKFIPISSQYLQNGHLKCAWDAASIIYNQDPTAKLFKDKSLIMGGSLQPLGKNKFAGDISAIILKNFPKIGRPFYTPDFDTALMDNWEDKIIKMAGITSQQNVTLLAGVPTWTIILFNEVLKQTGKSNISEVWPNIKSFLHGGVNFEPYRDEFKYFLPSEKIIYREVYNASEGYFAIQDDKEFDGMLLLCNHEIFYEFIPLQFINYEFPTTVLVEDLDINSEYALVITTSSGLYRYIIGDIIQCVSKTPIRIKITGRTHQQINVFGEEVSISNVSKALSETCHHFNAIIKDFTVAPIFIQNGNSGSHEWFIEFKRLPDHQVEFAKKLDDEMRIINSDYDAKRTGDLALSTLKVNPVPTGTFEKWYRSKSKYGGQHKVPRLRNDRKLANELNTLISNGT